MTIWTMLAAAALVVWAISLALGLTLVTSPQKLPSRALHQGSRGQATRSHTWVI